MAKTVKFNMDRLIVTSSVRRNTFRKHVLKIASTLVVVSGIGSHASAIAQQFGLNMGESAAQIKARGIALKKVSEGQWSASYLPYGNKAFDDYRLLIAPKYGLCRITAWISRIQDNSYGDTTKGKFLSLKEALTGRYGTPSSDYDFLREGALWRNSNEWMWSLSQKERTLASFWSFGATPVKNSVADIMLEAVGLSPETSMIKVVYEFTNIVSCTDELKNRNASNL